MAIQSGMDMNKIIDGKRDGLWVIYYYNGNLMYRINYKKGKRDGLYERYYENGSLCHIINYKDDKVEGLYEEYYDNGNIRFQYFYENDLYLGGIDFQNTGVLNRNK
jgi:antitoxin component YwqK of YwqJK toxin-antitoxin module